MSVIYTSENIIIREFLPSERAAFCGFFEDDRITRFLPKVSLEQYGKLFDASLQDYQKGPFGRWGIVYTNTEELIGNCLLRPLMEQPEVMEIGYSIKPDFWGKGLGTEIATALVNYGFSKTNADEISALTEIENISSQKVLKKSGFLQKENRSRNDIELSFFSIKRMKE